MDQKEIQKELLKTITTLFINSEFVAEAYFLIPNAGYEAILTMLNEHEEFFKSRRIMWQLKHKELGFELRFDRTNWNLERRTI